MSNTFVNISTYTNAKSYSNRLKHNGRKSALDKKDMLNIVEKDLSGFQEVKKQNTQSNKSPTRSQLSDTIANLKYRQKRAKKESTKKRLQDKIDTLTHQRDNTQSKREGAKANYIEMVFTITNVEDKLKRDSSYATELGNAVADYIQSKFPKMEPNLIAVHLDQSNPHVHINGIYQGENSITKDLQQSFNSKKKQYSDLQKDFNRYIRNHQLAKEYNLTIEHTVKGGRKDYLKLPQYKALEARMKKVATKQVDTFISKKTEEYTTLGFTNKDAIIKALQNQLVQKFTQMKATSNLSKSVEEIILKEEKLIELTQKVVKGQKALEAKEAQFNIAVLNELELKEANELKILELEKALEDSRANEVQLNTIIHQKDEVIDKLSPHKPRNNPHRFGR